MPAISTAGTGETVGEDAALQGVAESLFHVSRGRVQVALPVELAGYLPALARSRSVRPPCGIAGFVPGDGLDRAAAQLCLAQLWHAGVGAVALRSGQQG